MEILNTVFRDFGHIFSKDNIEDVEFEENIDIEVENDLTLDQEYNIN